MDYKNSFAKVKISAKVAKYIFKIGDHDLDVSGYRTGMIDGEKCILFNSIDHMYEFQENNGIDKFSVYLFNCDECDYHTDRKTNYDYHIESDSCRTVRGLETLSMEEKTRYKKSSNIYYCECCDYSPKLRTSKNAMKSHMKSKKHIANCKVEDIEIDFCLKHVPK